MKKPEFEKIINTLKDALKFLAKHAFFASLVLIFLSLLFGAFVFYEYSISTKEESQFNEKSLWLKETILQDILSELKQREEKFNAAESKECADLFRVSPEEELTE